MATLAEGAGAAALAGEERDRMLPVVLATGIGRGRLLLSKLAALTLRLWKKGGAYEPTQLTEPQAH